MTEAGVRLPWQREAAGAAHGGLWTGARRAGSVLGPAAALGVGRYAAETRVRGR